VVEAAQLSIPDPAPSLPIVTAPPSTDPRLRATTARGVSASGLPAPLREAWASPRQRGLLIGAAAAVLTVAAILVARGCAHTEGAATPALVASALQKPTVAVVAPLPVAAAAPSEAPSAAHSGVPKVSLDELPRERRKKSSSGAATPAKKDDPFARRR
jgi:hypothetical protein